MNCENHFCIYQENNECLLKEISLDVCGNCTECIYIELEPDVLSRLKTETRERIENRYNEDQTYF